MSKRPTSGKRFSRDGANLRPIRLVLEPLEARRLLAGLDLSGGLGTAALLGFDHSTDSAAAQHAPIHSRFESQSAGAQSAGSWGLRGEGELAANSFELSENATPGTLLGRVAFEDSLSGQQYTLHSADTRFSFSGRELYFSGGGLNFESEPTIEFGVNAVDEASRVIASTGVLVYITGVGEAAPRSIELSGGQVYEHEPGAIVGGLHVSGPDSEAQHAYAFYLFDTRFTMSGSQLRLADGIELDYATEPEVMLAVAATNGTHEIFDTVRIEVLQRSEMPVGSSSIALSPGEVLELTAGAPVGQASVVDPQDDVYEFSVSDERFEFVGDRLKLRDDRQVNADLEPEITLELTAVGDRGDQLSGTFLITVNGARSPYHNYNLNEDVNGDGFVSPIDALLIINELNARGSGPVTTIDAGSAGGPPPMLDVNGDGMITPIDVLIIINYLNRTRSLENAPAPRSHVQSSSATENSAVEQPPPDGLWEPLTDADPLAEADPLADDGTASSNLYGQPSEPFTDRRQRENASIDAELELLLEQLSLSQQAYSR